MVSETQSAPLAGITVLDLGQVYQGPYAGFLLAQAGADVIKIEPPRGEPVRHRARISRGNAVPFAMLNANKQAMHAVRIMLKKKAMAGANGYCQRFNTTGIPCFPCKFSPCEEWEELMGTTLSNTIYKDMPDAVRRAAGRGFRVPFLEDVKRIDLAVMEVEVSCRNAFCRGGVRLNVDAIANVKISSEPRIVRNAIERFLGQDRHEVLEVAKNTLEGHLRSVLANLTPEEVNQDTQTFEKELRQQTHNEMMVAEPAYVRVQGSLFVGARSERVYSSRSLQHLVATTVLPFRVFFVRLFVLVPRRVAVARARHLLEADHVGGGRAEGRVLRGGEMHEVIDVVLGRLAAAAAWASLHAHVQPCRRHPSPGMPRSGRRIDNTW